ncbi:MAG: hypothetical protein WAT71_17960 [Ignavibacteria bacterium]
MQKAIIVTSYNQNEMEEKYSIEKFNELLKEGNKVITCTLMKTTNSTISEFLVIIEDSELEKKIKP